MKQYHGSFSDFLNWGALVAPGVVSCKDGSLIAVWQVTGLDTESLEPEFLEATLARLARGIASLGDRCALWMRLDRRRAEGLEEQQLGHLPLAVQVLESEARGRLVDGTLYTNVLHLGLQYRPEDKSAAAAVHVAEFAKVTRALEARLGTGIRLERLGAHKVRRASGPDLLSDNLVNHLAQSLSGETRWLRVPKITEHLYLDSLLAVDFEQQSLNDIPRIGGRPCAVLSVDGLPAEYAPEALSQLEVLDFEYAWVSRFLPQSRAKTRNTVTEKRRKWRQSAASITAQAAQGGGGDRDLHADIMAHEADEVIADVGRGGVVYGTFTSTLTIFGAWSETADDLMDGVEAVRGALLDAGFSARLERHAAFEVFLASLPGHMHRNPRDVVVSSRNFADLMPLGTLWKGEAFNPSPLFAKKSPTLMLGRSSSGELFQFNLHHGEVGHTMVFGPTSGGKSVLLASIAGHFLKYPSAQVIYFDKRRSVQYATCALGGSFTSFGGTDGMGVAPLLHLPELGRDWGVRWLKELMLQNKVSLTSGLVGEIDQAIENMLRLGADGAVSGQNRRDSFSLGAVRNFISDIPARQAVERYLRKDGETASILDAEGDNIDWRPLTVFETHELFDMDESHAVLVLDYLFASVEKRFDGRPTLLVIDEAWAFLGHAIFVDRIRTWLKEMRKANVAVVLATQSLSDVVDSPITPVLLESCFTKIFLPNAGAKTTTASEQYKALGLNAAQIDLVASLVPKQDYYVTKPEGQRVVNFDFGPLTLSLVGRTSIVESTRAAASAKRDPDFWKADLNQTLERSYLSGTEQGVL